MFWGQPSNALSSSATRVRGNASNFNFRQNAKQWLSRQRIPRGQTDRVRELQLENVPDSMLIIRLGNDLSFRFTQSLNALQPIISSPAHMFNTSVCSRTHLREEHRARAACMLRKCSVRFLSGSLEVTSIANECIQ
jgi:hypothetical protein